MGFWPFGRKSRRTSRLEGTGLENEKMSQGLLARPATTGPTPREAAGTGKNVTRTGSKRKQREKANRLTKPSQTRLPSDPVRSPPSRAQTAPQAPTASYTSSNQEKTQDISARAPTLPPVPPYYQQNPASSSSIGRDDFTAMPRAPTLRAKRSSAEAIPRRKSSKRKADDHAREQEIRAMSSHMPLSKRPTSRTGGPLRRETKKVPGGLNRHFDRPASEVSLPLPESYNSSISEVSDSHTFKVKALDLLAPRPTLRYTENPRSTNSSKNQNVSRASARTGKRPVIPEEEAESRRRIDDFADNLNTQDIRELMERDARRREKKRQSDQEKLERRLQRRADRQAEEERGRNRGKENEPPTEDPFGLGINETTLVSGEEPPAKPLMGDLLRSKASGSSWLHDPSRERVAPDNPFKDEKAEEHHDLRDSKMDALGTFQDQTFLRADTPQDVQMEHLSTTPPSSPIHAPVESSISAEVPAPPQQTQQPRDRSSMSQMSSIGREATPDISERADTRRSSNQSEKLSSWTTFFKRGGTRKRSSFEPPGRKTPSEFSNTSRESFARQAPPPPIPPRSYRRSGSTPQRTRSKFREDLPELPLSPPDSRMQSPEAAVVPLPQPDRTSSGMPSIAGSSGVPVTDPALQEGRQSLEMQSPTSATSATSRAAVGQSLASVDSEGSWLSGKPAKRTSQILSQPIRESAQSLTQKLPDFGSPEEEDVTEDPFLSRLSPEPDDHFDSAHVMRKASSNILGADSDGESEAPPLPDSHVEGTWHSGVARRPTLVRQRDAKKSAEGLLNQFHDGEGAVISDIDSPGADEGPESPDEAVGTIVHRATSVDYGKRHARHISAGSAKLLHVPGRRSTDSKRLSLSSAEPSPSRKGFPEEVQDVETR